MALSLPERQAEAKGRETMLYLIDCEDKPDGGAIRAGNRDAHFAYLAAHHDIVVLGGALLAEDGVTRIGSSFVVNVPSREAAEAFSRNEPFTKAGLFREVRIRRMRRGQWNPAAAPATAEGN
jgi:uncharacterized protein